MEKQSSHEHVPDPYVWTDACSRGFSLRVGLSRRSLVRLSLVSVLVGFVLYFFLREVGIDVHGDMVDWFRMEGRGCGPTWLVWREKSSGSWSAW